MDDDALIVEAGYFAPSVIDVECECGYVAESPLALVLHQEKAHKTHR